MFHLNKKNTIMNVNLSLLFASLYAWFLEHGITIILVIVGGYILKKIFDKFIKTFVLKLAVKHDESGSASEKRARTLISIFTKVFNIFLVVIVAMMVVKEFGVDITPIIASVGIIGVAVGFGAQYLVKDVITGLFIIIENQYRIGDVVTIGGVSGVVESVNLRDTVLRDVNGIVHYVPHGSIDVVSNFTRKFSKFNFDVGISYNADINKAIEVINKVGKDLKEDPIWGEKLIEAPAFVRVADLANSSVNLRIGGMTKTLQQWAVEGEMKKRVKEGFDASGIEIPFPQMVIHNAE